MGKTYVTTPIYYVNDRPHIGHVYTTTVADAVARRRRLAGDEVFFLTGTDEHAAKVVDAAAERGLTTKEWADRNAQEFRDTFERLRFTHDDFWRTSQARHIERVERYVKVLLESGDVYLGEYEGWYDAGQEEYVPETKAKETDYKSPINGKPLVRKAESNYFFKLSAYGEELAQRIEDGRWVVEPEARRNEVLGRIREGLQDVPMSRTGGSDWGVKVPGDEAHTVYVWIDALFNYLTAVDTDARRHLWPADEQVIGKDILWFHGVIWPCMLLALAKHEEFAWVELPKRLYAHSFWMGEGKKMSKSLGNFVDLEKLDQYAAEFGQDALRYFLATRGPLGTTDSDFSHERFVEVYNGELANGLGNCLSRVTNMTHRYFKGELPGAEATVEGAEAFPELAAQAAARAEEAWGRMDLEGAARAALELVSEVDGFIERTQPFKVAKDPERLPEVGTILWTSAEALRVASVLLWPFLPHKVEELWGRFGCGAYAEALAERGRGELEAWVAWGQLAAGTQVAKGSGLFPRVVVKESEAPKPAAPEPGAKKAKKAKAKAPSLEPKEVLAFEEFTAVNVRVAKVVEAQPVPKADKLLQLTLELEGGEQRTVLSGIRAAYDPEALIGRQVVYLANLAPRKIFGIESQGMVLAANDAEGQAILLRPDREAPVGSRVR